MAMVDRTRSTPWSTRESLPSGDGATDYAHAVEDFLDHPELAINDYESLGGGRQYGAFVVAAYFSEAVSGNFVLDTWRTLKQESVTPIEAVQQVVDFYGRDMGDLLLGFAVANHRLDVPSDATFFLGARDGYDEPHARTTWQSSLAGRRPPRAEHNISPSTSRSGLPEVTQGGATYVELRPSGSGGRLDIELDALVGDYQYALLTWSDGVVRPDMEPIDMARGSNRSARVTELTASLRPGEVATLVIARTDVSTNPHADPIQWNASLRASGDGPKIMVVGDSITHGNEGSHSWRYVLDQHLNDNGVAADFVGPRTGAYDIHTDIRNRAILDGLEPPPQEYYPGPSTARYYDNGFDRDHNAMWGWTFADANNTIERDVNEHDPDYLLIALGFNDITWGYSDAPGTVASARTMIDEARAANPDIRILISNVVTRTLLPEFEWLNPEIREYAGLLESEVASLSTDRSPVHLVDISSGYDPVSHAWDGLHPNARGDYFIGSHFADALHGEFGVGAPYGPVPSDPPDVSLDKPAWIKVETTDQGFRVGWARVFGAAGYHVWTRNVTENQDWLLLPLPVPGDYFYSTWVRDGDTYEFRVAPARGDDHVGPVSDTASAVASPRTLPGPPNVTAQVDGTEVVVRWDSRTGAQGYRIYWIEALGNYPVMRNAYVDNDDGNSYRITGLEPGMRYDVGVSSVNGYGAGIPSGTLNQVVVPGVTATGEERSELAWEARDEALTATEELWEGYPEGTAPIIEGALPTGPISGADE
ncbi:fibronectin type III domain-containing protein [Nocardiopsis akebiae]|uniref:Fibronectin type III domain-containing protein n=1 Tax=Nocardiopsis akebiae TaxID=2831968 RepID=A0ABX8BY25_9ACTN|nr:SGNH/GDSL hydrolase family protein [Nocardiopsis akebiae]QUX26892.1 fibronectin type III domain-containing protein [Nocardiopsis akebiae]